jgi:predicted nucleic acid-binding protein
VKLGLDTGFFVRLLEGQPEAVEIWEEIKTGESESAISCVCLYELDRLGLKGALDREASEVLLEELPQICEVVWLGGSDLLSRAARIGHGTGMSMADALILASLVAVDVDKVYTTDTDLGRFRGGPPVVTL